LTGKSYDVMYTTALTIRLCRLFVRRMIMLFIHMYFYVAESSFLMAWTATS